MLAEQKKRKIRKKPWSYKVLEPAELGQEHRRLSLAVKSLGRVAPASLEAWQAVIDLAREIWAREPRTIADFQRWQGVRDAADAVARVAIHETAPVAQETSCPCPACVAYATHEDDGAAEPWPLTDVLRRLCNAADHLLGPHNCDHHGYEEIGAARDAGRVILGQAPRGAMARRTKPCTCHSPTSGPGRKCASPDGRGLGEDWHCEETGAVGLGASPGYLARLEAQTSPRCEGADARQAREEKP